MVRSAATLPFVGIASVLFAAGSACIALSGAPDVGVRLGIVAGTIVLAAIAYVMRPAVGRGRAIACYVVLAKYPLLCGAVAPGRLLPIGEPGSAKLLLLSGLFLVICLFETLDDVGLRASYAKPVRP